MIKKIHILLIIILLSGALAYGQTPTQVEIQNADVLYFAKTAAGDFTRLIGNCIFKQDNMTMYCDSAYLYNATNTLDAFGHVVVNQADTLSMKSDKLHYEGNTKLAIATGNVVLTDFEITLTTPIMNYDANTRVATYYGGGKLTNGETVLTSRTGYYYSTSRDAFFKNKVVLVNKDYTLKSDTLQYNTLRKNATIFGPTTIKSKIDDIYVEQGGYNTLTDVATGGVNSVLRRESQILKANDIFYNRKTGMGTAKQNVVLIDTVQKVTIYGQYAELKRKKSFAFVTQKAYMNAIIDDGKDTLTVAADTLLTTTDSTEKYKILKAFRQVKIYSKSLVGRADSLTYTQIDSQVRCFKSPILWTDSTQLTADQITLQLNNKKLDKLYLYTNAFIANEEDSTKYNQVRGKNMVGNFIDNKIQTMKVTGNGQSVYYAREDSARSYIGVNVAECTDIILKFKNNKAQRINFIAQPVATFYPIEQLPAENKTLKGFKWQYVLKPKSRNELTN